MSTSEKLSLPAGVVCGDEVQRLLDHAKENEFALPAVNVTTSSTANSVMEVAAELRAPVIFQRRRRILCREGPQQ
jgi:fructose-bisphosphate aldolase class II